MSEPTALPLARLAQQEDHPGHRSPTMPDEGVLLRLALWLADVAAEAALAGRAGASLTSGGDGLLPLDGAGGSRVAGSTR